MMTKPVPRTLSISDRLYRTLLLLYPADHRRDYGPLMAQLFRDMCHDALETDGILGLIKLWGRTVPDIICTATREYLEDRRTNLMTDIPAKIDRFEVKEVVFKADVAMVYRAHDPKTGRDVAVKTARPQIDVSQKTLDTSERTVFEWIKREAEVLAQLDHPAIPKYYGFFEDNDTVHVVMDFIKGKTLLEVFEEHNGYLPEQDVIDWAAQICDFLIYMHNQQPKPLIFRDMKPGNIMIDPDGKVYIIDFGIADWAAAFGLAMIGTIGYSPPEQYAGQSDARSDIFALGATLYHVLTGRDPRKEHSAFLFHVFPPRSLNPALSEKLEAVILKAVEHKAEERYQSAEAMKAALLDCA